MCVAPQKDITRLPIFSTQRRQREACFRPEVTRAWSHERRTRIGRALLAGDAHDRAKIVVAVRDDHLEITL